MSTRLLRAVTALAVTALAIGLAGVVAAPTTAEAHITAQTAAHTTAHTPDQTTAHAPAPPRIIQLGDSYSAGNGAGSYIEKTCWRSSENYGSQVAETLGARYRDVACSGAVVKDIRASRALGTPFRRTATYRIWGRSAAIRLAVWKKRAHRAKLCGLPPAKDMYYAITVTSPVLTRRSVTATAQCQLKTSAQIAAVSPATDLILLTIGGNDIGFGTIVAYCLIARAPAECEQSLQAAQASLPKMAADTKAALAEVDRRAWGRADIYLVHYPFLLNTAHYGIPEGSPTFDAGAALRDLQLRGNALQNQLIAELNARPGRDRFHVVDIGRAWDGDVHGLDPHVVADNSDAWLVPPFAPGREVAEWVHPTLAGWTATASAVRAAVTS